MAETDAISRNDAAGRLPSVDEDAAANRSWPSQRSSCNNDDDDDCYELFDNGFCNSPSFDHGDDDEEVSTNPFDDSCATDMSLLHQPSACLEVEKLQMRRWVVTSILDGEKTYLCTLDVLLQLMQTFRNLLSTEEPVLSAADIDTIFCKVADIHEAHDTFVAELQPLVENWSDQQQVAEPVKLLAVMEYRVAAEFLTNYPKAVSAINRCWKDNQTFASMTKEIVVQGMKEKQNLEQMLYTPVVRFQRNSLVLHDLIKCTPMGHPDYDPLQKALIFAQQIIENFDESTESSGDSPAEQRYLAKHGLVVEKVGDSRKLRLLLLFNDVLVCADRKRLLKQVHFDAKWFIPLTDVTLHDRVNTKEEQELADRSQADIRQLQRTISDLRRELKLSKSAEHKIKRQLSISSQAKITKIRKKLMEQQLALIKASPKLLFRINDRRQNRLRTLLMASDYERATWRAAISDLLVRARALPNITAADMQHLLTSKQLPNMRNLIGIDDLSADDERLFGTLNITICGIQGVADTMQAASSDIYCTVEVDSFNHFSTKAKTKAIGVNGVWNENFEIELEGTQIVRVPVYRANSGADSPVGMCALELSSDWLTADPQEKIVSINKEMSLTLSLGFSSRSHERTLVRHPLTPSSTAVFGANIEDVQKQEGTNIPFIIATCIQEIERRGLTEEGLYRICGSAPEIKRLKKAFEKHSKSVLQLTKDAEIAVLAGLVKMYFRELPESLFTDAVYKELSKTMALSDPDTKMSLIVKQLKSLPEPNRSTVIYVIDHIIRVSTHESDNKMSIRNLTLVFGPTLLQAPANDEPQTLDQLLPRGPHDVVLQTEILSKVLHLRTNGVDF